MREKNLELFLRITKPNRRSTLTKSRLFIVITIISGGSDVSDFFMLATFSVMLVIFLMYLIGHQHPVSVTNISNLSPTHLVSNIRHQHRCNHQI